MNVRWKSTSKTPIILILTACLIVGIGTAFAEEQSPNPTPVKQSRSGICHCPGGSYYERTKNFTAFLTIEKCLASGGRHPKRGQGDCSKATPVPDSPETIKRQ